MRQRFWQGQSVRAYCNFTDLNGAPLSVATVTFKARCQDGTLRTAPGIAADTVGLYYADFDLDRPGVWSIHADCVSPGKAVAEDQVEVRANYVTP